MNHLILIALIDNRIHNLKGMIKTYTYCIDQSISKELYIPLKEESEKAFPYTQYSSGSNIRYRVKNKKDQYNC